MVLAVGEGEAVARVEVAFDQVVHAERRVVFVPDAGGVYTPRDVETGAERDDRIEIRRGLAAGDRVVTRGAFLLKSQRPAGCRVTGLTSARHRAFCEASGYYDRVLAYEDLPGLDAQTPVVFVDMAGDGKLLISIDDAHQVMRAVRRGLADQRRLAQQGCGGEGRNSKFAELKSCVHGREASTEA